MKISIWFVVISTIIYDNFIIHYYNNYNLLYIYTYTKHGIFVRLSPKLYIKKKKKRKDKGK